MIKIIGSLLNNIGNILSHPAGKVQKRGGCTDEPTP